MKPFHLKVISYIICLVTFLPNAVGQIDCALAFYSSNDFKFPVNSAVILIAPTGQQEMLFQDTIKSKREDFKNLFNEIGIYQLTVKVETKGFEADSIIFPFTISGEETAVLIQVNFYNDVETKYSNRKWIELNSTLKGMVTVNKYFKPHQDVSIELLSKKKLGMDPIFEIDNQSKHTLYGEWLPGYFWGYICLQSNGIDNTLWSKKISGNICTSFVPKDPLFPNCKTFAAIGSFGRKLNSSAKYKYAVLYTIEELLPIKKRFNHFEHMEWWTKVNTYFKLEHEFEIE